MSPTTPHPPASPPVALVTGAADRIGAAMARRLARAGWAVIVHYRASADKAEAVVRSIRDAGGKAAAVQADLANRAERAGLIAAAARPFGPLTLLVNNASSFERDAAIDLDEALWDAHFAVHAEAPAFLARDFAAQLPAGAEGNIVNIIDERVLDLSPAFFSYTLSQVGALDHDAHPGAVARAAHSRQRHRARPRRPAAACHARGACKARPPNCRSVTPPMPKASPTA